MSRGPRGKIVIDSSRCKGCGLCIEACPKKHIYFDKKEDSRGIRVPCFEKDHECTGCALVQGL